MSNIVPAHRPSWAWNYRWSIVDVDHVREMARRGEPVSWIARTFKTTIHEVIALGQRNDINFAGGGGMTRALPDAA
jgi:hypothetical protein